MGDDWLTIGGVGVGGLALTAIGGFLGWLRTIVVEKVKTLDAEIEACKTRDYAQNERLTACERDLKNQEKSFTSHRESIESAMARFQAHMDSKLDNVNENIHELRDDLREIRRNSSGFFEKRSHKDRDHG